MRTRIQSAGGVLAALLLLALTLSALFASTVFAAPTAAQSSQARGQSAGTVHRNAAVPTLTAPLTQLQRAHGGSDVPFFNAAGVPYPNVTGSTVAAGSAVGATFGGRARALLGGRGLAASPIVGRTAGAGWIAAGLTVAALLVGLAFWGLSRGSRRAEEMASVTNIAEASAQGAGSPAEHSERKAA